MEKIILKHGDSLRFLVNELRDSKGIRNFAFFSHERRHIDNVKNFFFDICLRSDIVGVIDVDDDLMQLRLPNGEVFVTFNLVNHNNDLLGIDKLNDSESFALFDIRKTTKDFDQVIVFVKRNESGAIQNS